MRIAYDYGFGPRLPGVRPPRPGEETVTRQVLVLKRGASEEEAAALPGSRTAAEGVPIPGTDYRVATSDAADERDREVRAHERAHLANLGGAAASGVIYETRRGPDGEQYAVGAKIKADLSPVPGNPRATLDKARSVITAALAPGSPSAADMRTAAEAYRLAREARQEIGSERWA